MKEVLQKLIAASGLCSRRRAEEFMRAGRVTVNGKRAELGMRADARDDVRVSGKKIVVPKEKTYIKLNKPAGYTCTNRKFKGEKSVFDILTPSASGQTISSAQTSKKFERAGEGEFGKLHIVGRLDKNSRGLVLLTNDGELTVRLTHPRYGHEKAYEMRISADTRRIAADIIVKKLRQGVDIGDGDGIVRAKRVRYLDRNRFEIVLTEGKKRQIRRMFRILGYEVEDLARTAIGGVTLGNLPEGKWRYLRAEEIEKLKNAKI